MCIRCVREGLPERGRTCLEDGVYLINWKGCGGCGSREPPVKRNFSVEVVEGEEIVAAAAVPDGEGDNGGGDGNGSGWTASGVSVTMEEETTFEHVCSACDHVVCEHYFRFETVASDKQEYQMDCVLCGKGVDSIVFDFSSSVNGNTNNEQKGHQETRGPESTSSAPPAVERSEEQRHLIVNGLSAQISTIDVNQQQEQQDAQSDDGWEC